MKNTNVNLNTLSERANNYIKRGQEVRQIISQLSPIQEAVKDYSVTNKEHVEALIRAKSKNTQLSIHGLTVKNTAFGLRCALEVKRISNSRIYCNSKIENETYQTRNLSSIVVPIRFTNTFMNLTITTETKEYADILFGGIIIKIQQSNGWVNVYSDMGTNMETFTDLSSGDEFSAAKLPSGSRHLYKCLCWTASSKRQFSATFMKINDVEGYERFEILDTATNKALTEVFNEHSIRNDSSSAVQKAMGYIGNVMTGSINFGEVAGYVRYYNKWLNNTTETFLTDLYIEAKKALRIAKISCNEEAIEKAKKDLSAIKESEAMLKNVSTQDGQMYINARVFADMLSKYFGIQIDPKAITGLLLQLRPGTIKASAIIVSENVFISKVKGTQELADKAIAEAHKKVKDMDELSATKLIEKVEKDNRIEIVGDTDNLLYIADKNCVKLDYDMFQQITMEVLAFAKRSKSKMSKQLDESILFACEKTGRDGISLILEALMITVDNKLAELTVDRKPKIMTPEEIEHDMETGFVSNILLNYCPDLVMESKALYSSVWKQAINSITNIINKMSAELNAYSRRLGSDPAFILTGGKLKNIINFGEVVINDRRISKVAMIKYPKMGIQEYYTANNVTIKEIAKRCSYYVKKNIITKEEAKAITTFYAELDSYTAILPAKMLVAQACAGLDFDYDGGVFLEYSKNPKNRIQEITNEIIDAMFEAGMVAVNIDTTQIEKDKDNNVVVSEDNKEHDNLLKEIWDEIKVARFIK